MSILLLIGSYCTYGGSEKVVTLLANGLIARHPDWKISIAAFREACDPRKFGLSDRVACFSLEEVRLREILIERKIDLIINNWCLPFYVTRAVNKARKGLSIKLISILHGVPDCCKKVIVAEDGVRKSTGLARMVARLKLAAIHAVVKASSRYVYRQSDRYLVISKGFLDTFRDYTGLRDLSRLDYVYPLTDYMSTGKLESAKKKQILYVGRMDKENKRVNRIIDAWESVARDYPDWKLILVGGGPHLGELRAEVTSRGIPRVTFTGFLGASPVSYYRESSIFMLTSDLEGFGLVLVEAMSHGVVPIAYNSYVTAREIIDDGCNGFLTPRPYCPEATADRLRRLMNDEDLLTKMACAAVVKARQFSMESTLTRWEKLIGAVVS